MFLKFNKINGVIFLFLVHNLLFCQKDDLTAKEILLKNLTAISEVKGLKYHLKVTERGKKGVNNYESSVKFIKKPKKVYLYIKGTEVLWLEGKNKGKAYVKPNSFPYISLNLDPMGNIMRQDQHHTINEMGYDYFASIIEHSVIKIGNRFDEFFKLLPEEKINNRLCYKLVIENKDFGYTNYTVGDNESITSIARKNYVSEYLILEKNLKFSDYFHILKKGEVIKIPTWYCKTVEIYIDKFYFLPIDVKIWDEKGLFEEYSYYFLQVNPSFEPSEFTKDYKDYKF